MGKDDYDTVEKLSSLEYPIYFTYRLLNKINHMMIYHILRKYII